MSAVRLVIVLLVAALASVGLALTVRHMTASRPAVVQVVAAPAAPAAVRVLVARHDLKVGERLQPEDVAWVAWPVGSTSPAFITGGPVDPKNLANKAAAVLMAVTNTDPTVQPLMGSLVREAILANDPMNARKLVKGGQGGFMAIKLPTGMRAMALPVTVESGVGGFILPGDHVDVVLNVKLTNGGSPGGPAQLVQSRTLMRNLTVLAIDQTTEAKAGAASLVGVSATLQVPADDVDELAKARDEGTLLLALRSYQDIDGPQGSAAPSAPRHAAIQVRDTGETAVHVYRGVKLTAEKVP